MSYHIEDRSYPKFEQGIIRELDVNTVSELDCPCCGGTMYNVETGFDEEYMFDGTMERCERYYCDDCCTFADVTQVYAPTVRRVAMMQDVWDEEE